MVRTKNIRSGDWRTVEWFVNAAGTAFFQAPAGAQIKVRYGVGVLGKDRQKQTLNGAEWKRLHVSKSWSLSRARMQIRVAATTDVAYHIYAGDELITVPI